MPVAVLYLYCRTVDTLADERALAIGAGRALEEVNGLERSLRATLDGRPPGGPHALLWRRLGEVHQAYGLQARPLRQLLDGARWDLEGRAVRTRADLLAYADLVAGSVGAAMLPFLVRDRADLGGLDGPARALGNAMQVTNVLRDVGEDWRALGRTYLPQDELDAHGLDLGRRRRLPLPAPPVRGPRGVADGGRRGPLRPRPGRRDGAPAGGAGGRPRGGADVPRDPQRRARERPRQPGPAGRRPAPPEAPAGRPRRLRAPPRPARRPPRRRPRRGGGGPGRRGRRRPGRGR